MRHKPLGGALLMVDFTAIHYQQFQNIKCVCVCVAVCPQRSTVQMCGGRGRVREEQMCSSRDLCSVWSDPALLRQVAAHVKPLTADSNDTRQKLLAHVTQTCVHVGYVCVCACMYASSSVQLYMHAHESNITMWKWKGLKCMCIFLIHILICVL